MQWKHEFGLQLSIFEVTESNGINFANVTLQENKNGSDRKRFREVRQRNVGFTTSGSVSEMDGSCGGGGGGEVERGRRRMESILRNRILRQPIHIITSIISITE